MTPRPKSRKKELDQWSREPAWSQITWIQSQLPLWSQFLYCKMGVIIIILDSYNLWIGSNEIMTRVLTIMSDIASSINVEKQDKGGKDRLDCIKNSHCIL